MYQNHQFCGRRCANAFAVTQGQVDMLGYLSTLWSMPWNQSQQVAQAGGQPGQGGGSKYQISISFSCGSQITFVGGVAVQGLVNGFRSFISPANQVQQQQMLAYSMQSQQPPNDTFNPISSAGAITTTASQKMAVATLNQSNHNRPGPFNGARPLSLLSIQSTPSGIPALPVLNATNVGTTQPMRSNPAGMSFISRSTQSLSCASEPDDTYPYFDVSDQRVDSDRDLSEDGDGRYGRDEFTVGEVNVQSIGPPDSVGTCTLGGCSNPTIVDSITDLESEYCSWKHQQCVSFSLRTPTLV